MIHSLPQAEAQLNSVAVVILAMAPLFAGPLPFFHADLSTVGSAAAGSLLAFAYSPPVASRGRLFGYAFGGVMLGIWSVKILAWRGIDIPRDVVPAVAGLSALISQRVMTQLLEAVPSIIKYFTKSRSPE